jgi:hypothetical protein
VELDAAGIRNRQSSRISCGINEALTEDVTKSNSPNYFCDFITYALKRDVEPSRDAPNNILAGTDSDEYKKRFDAFETSFGYLLHSYNPPDECDGTSINDDNLF